MTEKSTNLGGVAEEGTGEILLYRDNLGGGAYNWFLTEEDKVLNNVSTLGGEQSSYQVKQTIITLKPTTRWSVPI